MTQSSMATGLWRGFKCRCPSCGEGPLLHRYLKVVPICPVCGHDNGQYPSDDAPPYFTILIIGHFVVAPLLLFPFIWRWPIGWVLTFSLTLVTASTLFLLPRVKGAVIGGQWAIHQREGVAAGTSTTAIKPDERKLT